MRQTANLVFLLVISFSLSNPNFAQTYLEPLGNPINGEAANDRSGVSISNSGDGFTVAIGAYFNDGNGSNSGHVRVFEWNGTTWLQKGSDLNGEASDDWSGYSVSINAAGNLVAIGAPNNDGNGLNSGHVRVYSWNGSAWTQQGTDINGEAAGDGFGTDVALSDDGSTLAVGAYLNDGNGSDAGHVRVFTWNGSTWIQKGVDINGEAANDQSGEAVALTQDGNLLVIGATGNDGNGSNAGHVRVYAWNGSAWIQQGADINGTAAGNFCGKSVEVSNTGTRFIVGAPLFSSLLGQARVFEWNGVAWVQLGSDILGEDQNEQFGNAVSMSGDGSTVLVGAFGNSDAGTAAGSARVFTYISSAWQQLGTDLDGVSANDQCGIAVSLSGDAQTISVSSYLNATTGPAAGHVRNWKICEIASSTDVQTACNAFTWINGQTYNTSNNVATFTFEGASSTGCDSIVTLDLTIIPSSQGIETISACGSYTWVDGVTYTASNSTSTYTYQNAAASGCDSVVTLNLTILPIAQSTNTIVSCTPITWIDGIIYSASNNTASFTYQNGAANGCDSIVYLNLTINSVSNNTVSVSATALTADNSSASYVWLDCNNNYSIIPGATAQTFNATSNGSYAVQLTQNGCVDTSFCISITTVEVATLNTSNSQSVFPNPSNGLFTLDLGKVEQEITVVVTDINGRTLNQTSFKDLQYVNLILDSPSGVYFLNISTDNQKSIIKVLKN